MGQMTLTEMVVESFAICVLIILVITVVSITFTIMDAVMQPIHDHVKKVVKHYLYRRWEERRNG